MSAAVKANLAAFIHNQQANSVRMPNTITPVNHPNAIPYSNFKNIVLCSQPLQAVMEKPRANSLPNGFAQQKLVWYVSLFKFYLCAIEIHIHTWLNFRLTNINTSITAFFVYL